MRLPPLNPDAALLSAAASHLAPVRVATAMRTRRTRALHRAPALPGSGADVLSLPMDDWCERPGLVALDERLGRCAGQRLGELVRHATLWAAPLAGWRPETAVPLERIGLNNPTDPARTAVLLLSVFDDAAHVIGAELDGPRANPYPAADLLRLTGALHRLANTDLRPDLLADAVGAARAVAFELLVPLMLTKEDTAP